MRRTLAWVAQKLGRPIEGTDAAREITGWSIDSRSALPGNLFIALQGPNHDGNLHVGDAIRNGAIAAIVDRDVEGQAARGLTYRVQDSLRALQHLAREARAEWGLEVIAVTGSAGKTTSKDIVAELLSEAFVTAKTEGNLNNHIGLPLSLLRMDEAARVAVIEMGMNHAGEIAELAGLAKPNVAVVTNVGWAHIENFADIEGIAAAKGELLTSLGRDGVAVLNADDPRVAAMAANHPGRTVLYGLSSSAAVRATDVEFGLNGVSFSVGTTRFDTQLTGRHNVSNLLAGIAVAGLYDIAPHRLVERVRAMRPPRMRGERVMVDGILIYNDCYNSNPDAARAMLDVLRDTPAKRRIAVLGEMLELGGWAEALHRDVGSYAVKCGIDLLVGIQGAADQMLAAAIHSGLRADATFFFENASEAGRMIQAIAEPGDAILFKGSRGVHVENALQPLLASVPQSHTKITATNRLEGER